MLSLRQRLSFSSKQLPEAVFLELVDIAFTPLFPIAANGVALVVIGILIGLRRDDGLIYGLTALGGAIGLARVVLIAAYHKRSTGAPLTLEEAKIWERRYAIGSYLFAATLGALNFCALTKEHFANPMLIPMLVTGLIFGYGAVVVSRSAVRPVICLTSVGLATIPTLIGFTTRTMNAGDTYAMAVFCVHTLVIAGFAVTGLESVAEIYRMTSQQILAKFDLAILAGKDDLTGLPNRVTLRDRFNEAIADREPTRYLAVHCLDLDRFKTVNDTLGHPAGDLLLKIVAQRLTRSLRQGDTAARLGGDEFVVVQAGIRHPDEARLLAHRIARLLSAPFALDGKEVHIGASIGVAVAPDDGQTLEQLIARADTALYHSKRGGRDSIIFWSELAAIEPEASKPKAIVA